MKETGTQKKSKISQVLAGSEEEILAEWTRLQAESLGSKSLSALKGAELRTQSKEFLAALREAAGSGVAEDINAPEWLKARDFLGDLSRSRAKQSFTPTQTATFVLSLKQPLFDRLRKEHGSDTDGLAADIWAATVMLDKLALHTTELYQKGREEIINRQQQEVLELSTPVVRLWQDILALPLIGTLDSARTQVVMESLLQEIVRSGASIAIIDITGVPTVDTLVAQHLLKTVAAARLMGADCIISGIRPQIAQTIVHLGVALGDVITKASLADALAVALKRVGLEVVRTDSRV